MVESARSRQVNVASAGTSLSFKGAEGMGPAVDIVQTRDTPPASTEVVIVGAGIIGVSAALFLARLGVSVVVCEKGQVAAEQSSRNWGWCRRMGRDPRELPLIVESLKLWDRMDDLVGEEVGFRRCGITYLCRNESEIAAHEAWLKHAGFFGIDSRIVRGDALAELLPGAARPFAGALHTPSDGRAEPQRAAPAIARAAMRSGATIVGGCAVRALDVQAGRVAGVITEKGRISASTVVVAGGIWSSRLVAAAGVRLPQLGVRSSVIRTGPVPGGPEGSASGHGFAFRKRLDGGYTIAGGGHRHDIVPDSFRYLFDFLPVVAQDWRDLSLRFGGAFFDAIRQGRTRGPGESSPFEEWRVLDPEPILATTERARRALEAAFPVFRDATVLQRWAGMIDATPDAVPVISKVKSLPGLVLATGFSGHGFGIGPGAGRLAANIVRGDTPIVDPTPYRYERFIDGTRPRPTTGV